jgi:hypothetical protein
MLLLDCFASLAMTMAPLVSISLVRRGEKTKIGLIAAGAGTPATRDSLV